MVVCRPRIVRQNPNQVSTIEQIVFEAHKHFVTVISRSGKKYNVDLSDRVRMTMNVETGDMAVIKTFKDRWLVVDLKKKGDF